jgi:hypothetical protein
MDSAARPKMPLLIDVNSELLGVKYEDVQWRVQVLAPMRQQFGPRWAILTGTGPVHVGVGRMFAVFSEIDGLEVGLFVDEDAAFACLRQEP